jgi:hypothetical protein
MWFHSLFDGLKTKSSRRRATRQHSASRRLLVEALEDRTVPASLSLVDATIIEGNAGVQLALVRVNLDAPSRQTVTVNYRTSDGTATAGNDYGATSGQLTFARGEMSKTIAVPVYGDRLAELNETFFVNLSGAQRAKIGDSQGVVTIVDDEPRINIAGASMAEGNSGTTLFTFTVSLSGVCDEFVTVNYATADGSGFYPWSYGWATTADNDYLATSGTLTFAPGETTKTITVEVVGDATPEPDEYFFVNLSGASGNALIGFGQALGLVSDDDTDGGGGGGGGDDPGDCTDWNPSYPNC